MHAWVTAKPIHAATVLDHVGTEDDGAILTFLGTVRRNNDGMAVRGMRYDAYESMAQRTLEEIASEAHQRWNVSRIAVVHRTGELDIGDVSVAIAVSAPHRAESFEAVRYIIEELKKRLPVWKKEHYVSGEERWLNGGAPPATGVHGG
ncbi:MAG: molybdenum cofactor biosynthesis protein MoaE [Longimicrobiales bacterium]